MLCALFLGAIALLMGAGDQDARVNDLGHRMMCVCSCNQILLECNHVGCNYSDRMRAELVAAVDRGDNDDLTLQWFVQKYGPTVIAAPTNTGFNRVAWVVPYLALVLGIVGVGIIVKAWNARVNQRPAAPQGYATDLETFRQQARRETEL